MWKDKSVLITGGTGSLGKKLTGQFKGFLRYRYGDYRVIYQVYNKDVTVVIIKVGHRSDVYRGNT